MTNKKFFYSCIAFYGSITIGIFLFSIKSPIIKSNRKSFYIRNYIQALMPEGFGYFTLKPHVKIINLYTFNENAGRYEKSYYFPLMNKMTYGGLQTYTRIYEADLQRVIGTTPIKYKIDNKEGESISALVHKFGNSLMANISRHNKTKLLKGTFIVSVQNVVPYEWRNNLTQDQMRGFIYKITLL